MRLVHEPHLQETEAYASKLLALDINIWQTSLVKQNHKRALELGDEAWYMYSVYKLCKHPRHPPQYLQQPMRRQPNAELSLSQVNTC